MISTSKIQLLKFPFDMKIEGQIPSSKSQIFKVNIKGKLHIMKVYPSSSQKMVWLYQNEVQVATGLCHPNILSLKYNGICQQDDPRQSYYYFITTFYPYETFYELFAVKMIKLTEDLLRTYFHQLVEAVEYMHSLGKYHLDIKPENLIIDKSFKLKLFDFDLSFDKKENSRGFLGKGTPSYCAPEVEGKKVKLENLEKCDVYSMGVVAFVFHNGCKEPFDFSDEKNSKILKAVFNQSPNEFWDLFRHAYPQVRVRWSKDFKSLIEGMLHEDPEKRFSIKDIKASAWYNGYIHSDESLFQIMKQEFEKAKAPKF